jgi:riboflavin synthase
MFTGIVKGIGKVDSLEKKDDILRCGILFPNNLLADLELGGSVAVDGVCLTIVAQSGSAVFFEAIQETLARTTLAELSIGSSVNLERSAKLNDEIGGHLLSGHVFGTATLACIDKNIYTVACSPHWMKYLFPKSYIAINGISLTVVSVDLQKGEFTVHLIPETLKRTTLGQKKAGDLINLEFDAFIQAAVETVERNLLYTVDSAKNLNFQLKIQS